MKSVYKTLLVKEQNEILLVTLNRPEKRNALNEVMVKELDEVFTKYKESDEIIGVMLTGAGNSFCAGADLKYLNSLLNNSYEENYNDSTNLKNMYWKIYTFPKPTVALINGPALAGGCGLMSVFDFVLSSDQAIFGYPEVKIGFVASIVSVFLIELIGLRSTKELLLTGNTLDASEAAKIGLINKVVKGKELLSAGQAFFNDVRFNSPSAVYQTKNLLQSISGDNIKSALDKSCKINAKSRQTSDFKEGLLSFLEKRKPVWGTKKAINGG